MAGGGVHFVRGRMEEPALAELGLPAEESRRDRLLRESFVLGFVVLLTLVLGTGVLSSNRVEKLESEISKRSEITNRELETIFDLEGKAAALSAQVITLKMALASNAPSLPAAHRVAQAREELDGALEAARLTPIGSTDEWSELEKAASTYSASLDPDDVIPNEPKAQFEDALKNLELRVRRDVRQDRDTAKTQREQAQRDIAFTTGACLVVGLVVSALSFVETRRRIRMIRRAYSRVATSKEVIESTLEGMDSAVLTLNLDGEVTRINGAALHVLGYGSAGEVVGRGLDVALAQQPSLLVLIAPLVESKNPGRRYLGRVELGRERWLFDVGASPLTIGGEVRGYIVTLSDVTEAERANEELRRNRALVAVGQMTAQVAHEIKNPLGGVRLAAQVLARKLAGDPQSLDVIRRIENSVDHLNHTVAELNQFARPRRLELAPLRLDALVDEILPMVADRIEAKGIRVERHYDEAVPPGAFDEGELRKAFLNFVINALDASAEGAVLELSIEASGDVDPSVSVAVRDYGEGMDEETRRRLFEPFYTTKAHGTGLGMAIAHKIVDLHRGRIDVTTAPGEGTTVTVTLPLTLVPSEVEAAAEERE